MNSDLKTIEKENFKPATLGLMACFYLAIMIVAIIIYGPSPILYILFAIVAGFLILPGNHFWGLALLIGLTMFFERNFTLMGLVIGKETYKLYLLDLIIIFSLISLFSSYLKKRVRLFFGWPETALAVFMLLVGIYLIRSLFDINAEASVAFSSFKNYGFYPLLYFLTIYTIDSPKKIKDLLSVFLLIAIGLIAFIGLGFFLGAGLWTEFTPLSTGGTRYLAGTHALYMLLAGLLAASLLFYDRFKSSFLSLSVMTAWALGVGLSLMRHLWLAAIIGAIVLFISMEKTAKKNFSEYAIKAGLVSLSLILLSVLAFNLAYFNFQNQTFDRNFSFFSDRLVSLTDLDSDTSASWRSDLWRDAKNLWQENPIIGIGFGKNILVDRGEYKAFEEVRNIHNSPLAILVQMGLLGILAFIIFIGSVLLSIRAHILKNEDLKPYYLGLLAGLATFLFSSLFQPYLETNLLAIWLWIFLGLLRTATFFDQK